MQARCIYSERGQGGPFRRCGHGESCNCHPEFRRPPSPGWVAPGKPREKRSSGSSDGAPARGSPTRPSQGERPWPSISQTEPPHVQTRCQWVTTVFHFFHLNMYGTGRSKAQQHSANPKSTACQKCIHETLDPILNHRQCWVPPPAHFYGKCLEPSIASRKGPPRWSERSRESSAAAVRPARPDRSWHPSWLPRPSCPSSAERRPRKARSACGQP